MDEFTQSNPYEELIRPVEQEMLRAVWSVTGNAEDADDALQDALVTLWRRFDRVRAHPNPQALILRVCLNSAYDVVRARLRRRRREQRSSIDTTPAQTPAEAAARGEIESCVAEAVGELPRNQATAFLMRVINGRSYEEVAQALGCRESTARKHVNRGRERLRALLAPRLEELE